MTAKKRKVNVHPAPQEPLVTMPQSSFKQRIASERKDALDAFEVFYCKDDSSHCSTEAEEQFIQKHGSHDFVRFRANDGVENPLEKDTLRAAAELEGGLYDLTVMVDGDVALEKRNYPVKNEVKVRVLQAGKFPETSVAV